MKKIVLTGGPCAGKTTALLMLKKRLEKKGLHVVLFSEIASQVLQENIHPNKIGLYEFQKEIFERQKREEDKLCEQCDLVLLDRGLIDHKAYLPKEMFELLLKEEEVTLDSLYHRYDGVLILQSGASVGKYRKETNRVRLEEKDEALKIDEEFVKVWSRHPHSVRIEAKEIFDEKVARMEQAILNELGIEFLDVVDENGKPTGAIVEREYAHQKGIWHRTSHVWIVRKCMDKIQILVQQRARNKSSFPLCFDISSAGHIPTGSGFIESAIRECQEELGISLEACDLHECGLRTVVWDDSFFEKTFHDRQISKVFVVNKDLSIGQFKVQKEELDHVEWFDLEELMKAVRDNSIIHCIALEELNMVANTIKKDILF